jgi:hypothetical protein
LGDLGNLLLTAVMFWAYCSFFQYLVIWSANLPEENIWYVHRSRAGWQYVALGLALFHFVVPFLLLLLRRLKRSRADLARIAGLLLVARYFDLYWLTMPAFGSSDGLSHGPTWHWLDLAAWLTIGGAWTALFAWRLTARAALPVPDPEVSEILDERIFASTAV